jgi:hypothetical protein
MEFLPFTYGGSTPSIEIDLDPELLLSSKHSGSDCASSRSLTVSISSLALIYHVTKPTYPPRKTAPTAGIPAAVTDL